MKLNIRQFVCRTAKNHARHFTVVKSPGRHNKKAFTFIVYDSVTGEKIGLIYYGSRLVLRNREHHSDYGWIAEVDGVLPKFRKDSYSTEPLRADLKETAEEAFARMCRFI